jgi:type IV pilus assembly protein PilV
MDARKAGQEEPAMAGRKAAGGGHGLAQGMGTVRGAARRAAAGFTLIEVLVAVLVLSLGVLGAAGMQAASLRANREARSQEVGTRMATELAELIRANHTQARNKTAATNPYLLDFSLTGPTGGADCYTGSSCADTMDIARRDVADWAGRATRLLPGLRVKVCYDAAPHSAAGLPEWACDNAGDTLYVKIGWTRSALDSSSTTLDAASVPAVTLPVTPGKETT